jgi:hypothetical protein
MGRRSRYAETRQRQFEPVDLEENSKLKRTFLAFVLVLVPASFLPLTVLGQVSSSTGRGSADPDEPNYKYEGFVGFGYTSLNQVNLSRSGLVGVNASITRDFGKYFGVTADGGYYKYAIVSGNPGDPRVVSVLFGPVIHAQLYGKYSGFVNALIGGEHSGGEGQTPNISFAGGVGGGVEYSLTPHISLRAYGDDIGASFSVTNNSSQLAYSPHRTWNPIAGFGAVYRF